MNLWFAKVRLSIAIAWFQGVVVIALMRGTWRGYCALVRAVWSVK